MLIVIECSRSQVVRIELSRTSNSQWCDYDVLLLNLTGKLFDSYLVRT